MKKYIFSLFIAIFLMGGAFVPSAQAQDVTIQDLLAQIEDLKAIIAKLQQQIQGTPGQAPSVAWCYDFQNSLRLGDVGSDVEALQTALQRQGYFKGAISGIFNTETFQGASKFQEKYQQEILAPFGITRGTGFVGRTTRAQLNKLYGCVGKPIPPIPGVRSITVLSPNGGETWEVGSTHTISWNAAPATRVSIDVIDESTGKVPFSWTQTGFPAVVSNTGSFVWTIPTSATSGNYRLKIGACPASISDLTCANTDLSQYGVDQSDNFFSIVLPTTTITPSITVLSPNGGEKWGVIGRPVSFKAVGVERVNIDLQNWSNNTGGGPLTWRLESNLPVASSGKYAVTAIQDLIPKVQSGDRFAIRVSDSKNARVFDQSDFLFSIDLATVTPSITVLSPNGGEIWKVGEQHLLQWKASNLSSANVKLEICYTQPGLGYICNKNVIGLPAGAIAASIGQHNWSIPNDPYLLSGSNFRFRVTDEFNNLLYDESDSSFSIVSTTTTSPSITVVLPNGGEEWFSGGNVYNIAWSSTNVSAVDIELADWSRAGAGGPLTWMIVKNIVPLDSSGNGKYSWKIPSPAGLTPSLEPGSQYEIRIYDTTNYSIFDTSNSFFKIDFNVLG